MGTRVLLCFWDSGFRNTKPTPDQEYPKKCYHASTPTASTPPLTTTADDHRLVANAGLILPATLALYLGLP